MRTGRQRLGDVAGILDAAIGDDRERLRSLVAR